MDKLLIGIGHKARQGKDSIANAIHRDYPCTTRVIGFADALKSYCRVLHRMTSKDAKLLQDVGVGMRESHGEDVWVRALEAAAQDASEPVILIPDVRFDNEAEFVKSHGGYLIKVERYSSKFGRYVAPDRDRNHPSETALDSWLEWDYAVENMEGCKHALRDAALTIFEDVLDHWNRQQAMAENPREVSDVA